MNVGIRLLQVSAVYLVIGLGMGLVMAMTANFVLTSVHTHILLLGWATMALAGIVYLLLPRCRESVLAKLHFWGHNLALPVMMVSLALFLRGVKFAETVVAVSSIVLIISLLIFMINLFRNAGIEGGK